MASSSVTSAGLRRAELEGHRQRLAAIRPCIDQSTPSSYFVLLSRAKKDQLQQDWAENVDSANLALLKRMTEIHNARPILDDHQQRVEERERRKREQSEFDRRRLQTRIDEENRLLLERLKGQKSSYGTGSWLSHARQYEKHRTEVRLRQLLISDPLHARQRIKEEQQKERDRQRRNKQRSNAHKLEPLHAGGAAAESYDRDDAIELQDAEDARREQDEHERKEAQVAAFDVSTAELTDAAVVSVGSISLSEFVAPQGQSLSLVHQDGHTIDSHHVILTIHEVNRTTARTDVSAGDWRAFTSPPPAFLHAFLVRSYDLDSAMHSHLYLPYQPMRVLGRGQRRVERIIGMLGFGEEGHLLFNQSMMPKQPKPRKVVNAPRRIFNGPPQPAPARQDPARPKAAPEVKAPPAETKTESTAVAVATKTALREQPRAEEEKQSVEELQQQQLEEEEPVISQVEDAKVEPQEQAASVAVTTTTQPAAAGNVVETADREVATPVASAVMERKAEALQTEQPQQSVEPTTLAQVLADEDEEYADDTEAEPAPASAAAPTVVPEQPQPPPAKQQPQEEEKEQITPAEPAEPLPTTPTPAVHAQQQKAKVEEEKSAVMVEAAAAQPSPVSASRVLPASPPRAKSPHTHRSMRKPATPIAAQ